MMTGVKVKIVVESGDAMAELKVVRTVGGKAEEGTVLNVGGAARFEMEYDLELSNQLLIVVEKVQHVEYNADLLMNVAVEEKKEGEVKKPEEVGHKPEPKSVGTYGAKEYGAKEGPSTTPERGGKK
jgi:hypothetical protein